MNIINVLQNNLYVLLLISGFLGLIVGSFINVIIHRLPIMLQQTWQKECYAFLKQQAPNVKMYNLFFPRSHCPKCHNLIPLWHNIPLLSYLILGGKCKHCHVAISWRYPLVELLSAATAIWLVYFYGPTIITLALFILSSALIAIVFIDFEHKLIPDNITLPLIWLGLLLNSQHAFISPAAAIIGAVAGYSIPWLIARIFKLARKTDGMGYGDFKLFALFGAWFGWQSLLLTLVFSSFLGSVVGITLMICKKHKFQQELPFGPYIIIAGWLNIFYGPQLWLWYLKILGT